MSDELSIFQAPEVAVSKYTDQDFDAVSKVGDYLPRLQVCGGNSEVVKEGKIDIGTYALVKDKANPTPLGKEVDGIVIAWRPKAMDMSTGSVLSYFNRDSQSFKDTQAKSDVPDSNCMFGPEFLVYLPSKQAFCSFYMGSKSARKEAPSLMALMKAAGKAAGREGQMLPAKASFRVKFIKTQGKKSYSWHAPQINPCTTPMEVAIDPDELREQVEKFNNPKESEVEVVNDSSGDRAR